MTNINLPVTHVLTLPINVVDADGATVPAPSGDTYSATLSDPTMLSAAFPAGGAVTMTLTPLRLPAAPPVPTVVTVADSGGLAIATFTVTVVAETAPYAIMPDFADATFTTQLAPTA